MAWTPVGDRTESAAQMIQKVDRRVSDGTRSRAWLADTASWSFASCSPFLLLGLPLSVI
jgi:hypothetical protein